MKVGILASGASNNVGDFLRGLACLYLVRAILPEGKITVFSEMKPDFDEPFNWQPFAEIHDEIKKSLKRQADIRLSLYYYEKLLDNDLVVLSQGTLHGYSRKAVIPALIGTEFSFQFSRLLRKKKSLIALGITYLPGPSPLSNFLNNMLLKLSISAASTRDYKSYQYLRSLGLERVIVAADLVFNLDFNKFLNTSKILPHHYDSMVGCECIKIGLNIRPPTNVDTANFLRILGKAIKLTMNKIKNKVSFHLIPLSSEDYEISLELIKILPPVIARNIRITECDTVNKVYVSKVMRIINSSDILIGMRYHFGILALICNKPFIQLCYHPKNINLVRELELRHSVDIRNHYTFNPEYLSDLIVRESRWEKVKEEKVEMIKKRAFFNSKLLKEILMEIR